MNAVASYGGNVYAGAASGGIWKNQRKKGWLRGSRLYLVSRSADVNAITRLGQSTADMARGGRSGFFTRVAYPETVELLTRLGSSLECLHTHFLDTGDFCAEAGVNDPWAPSPETPKDKQ